MSNLPKSLALLAALTLLLAADAPQHPAPHDLAPTLATLAEKHKLPGLVGAILQGDQLVALGSTGLRKSGDPAPFLTTDIIHLGSDTKAMTALLIGRLIDQKKLAFDTPMRDLFPAIALSMDPAMAKLTVRHLLTHTAGLPHDLDWWAFNATRLTLPDQRLKAVQKALAVPPASPIGDYAYSNVSFVLLGAIIEAKTDQAWEDVVDREIFQPLHMKTAGFGAPGTRGKTDQPWGHTLENGALKPTQLDNAPVMAPAGTVHCSIEDWSKFIAEILHAAQGHPTLISAETFKELTKPNPKQDYAGGWILADRPWAGGLALTHSGSNTTWYCTVWIAPKKDFAILAATNQGSDPAPKAVDEAIGELIKVHAQLPATH